MVKCINVVMVEALALFLQVAGGPLAQLSVLPGQHWSRDSRLPRLHELGIPLMKRTAAQ